MHGATIKFKKKPTRIVHETMSITIETQSLQLHNTSRTCITFEDVRMFADLIKNI